MTTPNVGGQAGAYVNDPDRKTPEHDAICQFVKESWRMVHGIVFPETNYPGFHDANNEYRGEDLIVHPCTHCGVAPPGHYSRDEQWECITAPRRDINGVGKLEVLLGQADRGGRFWVNGYVDVLIYTNRHRSPNSRFPEGMTAAMIGVEVKSKPCSTGELLRQVQFYSLQHRITYDCSVEQWVVVSPHPLLDGEEKSLAEHGVLYIQLGAAYESWKVQRKSVPASRVL